MDDQFLPPSIVFQGRWLVPAYKIFGSLASNATAVMLSISELLGSEARAQVFPASSLSITPPCAVPATNRECWLGAYASARTPKVEISLTRDHVLPASLLV